MSLLRTRCTKILKKTHVYLGSRDCCLELIQPKSRRLGIRLQAKFDLIHRQIDTTGYHLGCMRCKIGTTYLFFARRALFAALDSSGASAGGSFVMGACSGCEALPPHHDEMELNILEDAPLGALISEVQSTDGQVGLKQICSPKSPIMQLTGRN